MIDPTQLQKPENRRRVIVVGAGAAGMIAAMQAAKCGSKVTLLEKSERVGMKILISGGGKCNITHAGSISEILRPFRKSESYFLKPSFYRYTNEQILTIFHERFIPTYVRPDGRVFPIAPKNAKDVVAALERATVSSGVEIATSSPVTGIRAEDGRILGVECGDEFLPADAVIVAVGGSSYPITGTTGDGWRWTETLGHSIIPLRAALAPIYMENAYSEWSGVTLTDVKLSAREGDAGKIFTSWRGDLLFTHKGISGPCALGISRDIADALASGPNRSISLVIDLIPTCTYEEMKAKLPKDLQATGFAYTQRYLPKRLADELVRSLGIDGHQKLGAISPKLVSKLLTTIKEWPIGTVRAVPLERGEVVAGGVCLDEVDKFTMESKLISGLYLCGEVLDIAGPVGGYNLQAAWSTGFVAGDSAANAKANPSA